MASTLTRERVRSDVEVLSRAGLELEEFLSEAVASMQRAVPWVAACVGTHDPATRILTSSRKYGALVGRDQHDGLFGTLEYDSEEETSYGRLAAAGQVTVGMHVRTGGDVERSERMSRLMVPAFGYGDEARLTFLQDGVFWGGLALFRGPDDAPFAPGDLDYLAAFSPAFAQGVRAGVLARMARTGRDGEDVGPAVVLVGADGDVVQMSPQAVTRLAELRYVEHTADPMGVLAGLVAAARRVARGEGSGVPRARVRTRSGMWLVLHASPLLGSGDRAGEVVVTIEEARPPEIVSLVVAAFGLTQRERDVTALVLQGVDTKEIAATLHVSTYTVQDHLKSVFDKADVRSRRELISRIFFDQYVPRMGTGLGPQGWFAG